MSACELGLALGADHGLNYNTCDFTAEVMKFTGGKGVDVLYDNIANPKVLPAAFHALGMDGRLVTAGAHAGPTSRSISPTSITSASPSRDGRGTTTPTCRNALPPRPRARSSRRSSASAAVRAADAHRLVELGQAQGKIVLDPTLD